jgi:hypothetical protein
MLKRTWMGASLAGDPENPAINDSPARPYRRQAVHDPDGILKPDCSIQDSID